MKKVVCFVLLFAVMAGVLTVGFSQFAFAEDKIKINYWILMGASDKEAMDQMVAEFNATHPDVEVYSSVATFDSYYQQLTAAMAAGKGPDVATMHTRSIPAYASEKLMYPIDELIEKNGVGQKDFIDIAWEGGVVKGKRWAIPLDVIIAMVEFYNTDLFAKAGLTGTPQNGAELIEYAKKVNEATGEWGFEVPLTGMRLYRYWYSAFKQLGGSLLTEDYKKAAFNTPEAVKALQFWVDFIHKHQLAPDKALEDEGFRLGKVGLILDGIWMSNGFNQTEGLNWNLGAMPSVFDNGNRAFFSNSHNFVFPKPKKADPKRFEKAVEFALWLTENSLTWGKVARMVPARRSVIESDDYLALPWAKPLLSQVEDAAFPPQVKQTAQLQDILMKYLEMAIVAKISPEEAMMKAETEVNKIMK